MPDQAQVNAPSLRVAAEELDGAPGIDGSVGVWLREQADRIEQAATAARKDTDD